MPRPDPAAFVRASTMSKITDATRRVLYGRAGDSPGRAVGPRITGVGVVLIKTTSSITARSGTTPGSGTADLVTYDGSTLNTGDSITLLNFTGGTANTGKYGTATFAGGSYFLTSVECS